MNLVPRPEPFSAFTTPAFWNDPHIANQMLAHHLDPEAPMASRPHEFIDRSVTWLMHTLGVASGARVLDLGCGPGLYAHRLACRGIEVYGVDASARSLAHAREIARQECLPIHLRQGNYLEVNLGDRHDAAILIYEDYCALSPAQRSLLLARVRDALRPGGQFVFDVTSAARFADFADTSRQEPDLMDGFWAEPPYFGTHETWTYPELRLVLDRYTIQTGASTRQFWNWMQCLTPDTVAAELRAAGFESPDVYGDVTGRPCSETAPTFAIRTERG